MKRIHTLLFNVDKKDKTLLNTFDEVYLQGMGACVQKTIDLALQFQESYAGISIECETFTVPIKDSIVKKENTNGDFLEN